VFGPGALAAFVAEPFELTSESNRMGYRLRRAVPTTGSPRFVISEGTVPGAIQVPPDGQPILLMSDRQTTGGYPTMAALIAADLGLAGQLAPGDRVSFVLTDLETAASELRALEGALAAIEVCA
jgi:antagonist of KipI